MKNLLLTGIACIMLAGCSGCALFQEGETPEVRLYNATVIYGLSVKSVLVYETLPRCTTPQPSAAVAAINLCSEADAVASIRAADNASFSALEIFGTGIPTNPGLDALRATINVDRVRLHSDTQ